MTEQEERQRVIEIARSWIGTPYHHNAHMKGVGVDCAFFLAEVFQEAQLVDKIPIPHSSPQFMLHRNEELYKKEVANRATEISENEVQPGDIVLFRIGRVFAHGAIIISWPDQVIHSHIMSGRVLITRSDECDLNRREKAFFSPWKK